MSGPNEGLDTLFAGGRTEHTTTTTPPMFGETRMAPHPVGTQPAVDPALGEPAVKPKPMGKSRLLWYVLAGAFLALIAAAWWVLSATPPAAPAQARPEPAPKREAASSGAPIAVAAPPAAPQEAPVQRADTPREALVPPQDDAMRARVDALDSALAALTARVDRLAEQLAQAEADAQRLRAAARKSAAPAQPSAPDQTVAKNPAKPPAKEPAATPPAGVDLSGYALQAMHPGQAWLLAPGGKTLVVIEGSEIAPGVRVIQIDADAELVRTNAGAIRRR